MGVCVREKKGGGERGEGKGRGRASPFQIYLLDRNSLSYNYHVRGLGLDFNTRSVSTSLNINQQGDKTNCTLTFWGMPILDTNESSIGKDRNSNFSYIDLF